ncbi:MAG: hypothetical protein KH123_04430 [Azospirillum sp.]|jgi:hypothetical protein|nr:hypothetical protein [Azospirillum sp.]
MNKTFNIAEYLQGLSKDLVNAFDKAAKNSHPQAIGSGREKSVKDQLERLLPAGVGVGSGFVIDSYGSISKQCDIIIFEKDFALKFSPNDDELYTYYNCENVIAVGQVKSQAAKKEIQDSIENLKSVKNLKRRENLIDDFMGHKVSSFRNYLGNMSAMPAIEEQYDPLTKSSDNIFTFLICNSFSTPDTTILNEIETMCEHNKRYYPNRLLSVENDYCFWLNGLYKVEPMDAKTFTSQKVQCSLGYLILDLMNIIKQGRSVPNNKNIYFPEYQSIRLENKTLQLTSE